MTIKIKGLEKIKSVGSSFDFEYWSDLAQKDPAAFEVAREEKINQHISTIADNSTQDRLRRLQWRVEMERKRSKSAMDSAARIYDMMWESVGKNFDALQDLSDQLKPSSQRATKKRPEAKVLSFRRAEEAVCTAG